MPSGGSRAWASIVLGVIAALAYCSWPLGYTLNPAVAHLGFASDLEALGQPYNWLFILLDCVSGFFALFAALALRGGAPRSGRCRLARLGYALFGLFTALDAVIPLGCRRQLASCGADLLKPNLDDLLTGLAMISLFVSAAAALAIARRRRPDARSTVVGTAVLVTWSGCGLWFLSQHFSTHPWIGMQHLMLTLSSLLVAFVPVLLRGAQHDRGEASTLSEEALAAR